MNPLFRHIEYLMLRHDCVIVPSLGAFISTYVASRYDLENGKILPPSRSVMFNQAVTSDDGMLANSYARKQKIPFEEARLVLAREVACMQEELDKCGNIKCGSLGTLTKGDEDRIIFSPCEIDNSRSMGYEEVSFIVPDQECDAEQGVIEDKVNENFLEEDYDRYYHIRINKVFTKVAATIIAVFAIGLTIILNPIPRDERELRASVVPVDVLMSQKNAEESADHAIEENIIRENNIEANEDNLSNEEFDHYLIVATFSSEDEALKYVKTSEGEGMEMKVVPSKKMWRVAVEQSNDMEQLREILNSREIRTKFPNAWIWSRK